MSSPQAALAFGSRAPVAGRISDILNGIRNFGLEDNPPPAIGSEGVPSADESVPAENPNAGGWLSRLRGVGLPVGDDDGGVFGSFDGFDLGLGDFGQNVFSVTDLEGHTVHEGGTLSLSSGPRRFKRFEIYGNLKAKHNHPGFRKGTLTIAKTGQTFSPRIAPFREKYVAHVLVAEHTLSPGDQTRYNTALSRLAEEQGLLRSAQAGIDNANALIRDPEPLKQRERLRIIAQHKRDEASGLSRFQAQYEAERQQQRANVTGTESQRVVNAERALWVAENQLSAAKAAERMSRRNPLGGKGIPLTGTSQVLGLKKTVEEKRAALTAARQQQQAALEDLKAREQQSYAQEAEALGELKNQHRDAREAAVAELETRDWHRVAENIMADAQSVHGRIEADMEATKADIQQYETQVENQYCGSEQSFIWSDYVWAEQEGLFRKHIVGEESGSIMVTGTVRCD